MEIYLQKDGQQVGPYSEEQLRESVTAGTINQFDLACHEGMTGWQPLCTIISIEVPPPKTSTGTPHLSPSASTTTGTPHLPSPPVASTGTSHLPPPISTSGGSHLPPPDIALPPPDIVSTEASRNSLVPGVIQKLADQGAIIAGWACFIIGFYILTMHSWPFYFHYALFVVAVLFSIEALSQRKMIAGLSLLTVTLILPTFVGFGLLFYRANNAAEPSSDEAGKIQSVQNIEKQNHS